MDKAIAASYRRRGLAALRRQIGVVLTPRRRVITSSAGLVALIVALGLFSGIPWSPERIARDLIMVASFSCAASVGAAWICLFIWFRRDRRKQQPLTFVETGELGRVTEEDGSVVIPSERRATVAKATAFQAPRVASAALMGVGLAVVGGAMAPGVLVLVLDGGTEWFFLAYLAFLGVSNLYSSRSYLQALGHIDTALEMSTSAQA